MAIKLNSLARWAVLDPAKGIEFNGTDIAERRVRLNLNLESVTSFYVGANGKEHFLITAGPGLETVEFSIAGNFTLFAEKGSGVVQYQSADLEPTHAVVVDPVIFTRIANRRHRNPELEEMMYRMHANLERRFAQQADEMEAALARRIKEEAHGRPSETIKSDAPGTVAGIGEAKVPAQSATGEKPGDNGGKSAASGDTTGTGDVPAGGG